MRSTISTAAVALAVTALMAAGAAASAQAEGMHFTGTVGATLSGGQQTQHVWSFQGEEVTCNEARFTGEVVASPSPSQKINAEYSGCTEFGFINAEFRMNSCYYEFTTLGTDEPEHTLEPDYGVGSLHIRCNPGDSITVVAGPCVWHIYQQTVGSVTYHTTTFPGTRDVFINLRNIKSKVTGGFLCSLEEGEDETGTYTGTTEMSASEGSLGLQMT